MGEALGVLNGGSWCPGLIWELFLYIMVWCIFMWVKSLFSSTFFWKFVASNNFVKNILVSILPTLEARRAFLRLWIYGGQFIGTAPRFPGIWQRNPLRGLGFATKQNGIHFPFIFPPEISTWRFFFSTEVTLPLNFWLDKVCFSQEGGVDRAALSKLVVGEANAERLKQLEVTPRPTRFFGSPGLFLGKPGLGSDMLPDVTQMPNFMMWVARWWCKSV